MGYKVRNLNDNKLGLKYLDANGVAVIYTLWNENLDIINSTLGEFNTVVGVDSTNNVLIYTNPELDFNKYKLLDIPSFGVVQDYVKDAIKNMENDWIKVGNVLKPKDNANVIEQTAPQLDDPNALTKWSEYKPFKISAEKAIKDNDANCSTNSKNITELVTKTDTTNVQVAKNTKAISNIVGGVGLWSEDTQTSSISPTDPKLSVRVSKVPKFNTDIVNKDYVDNHPDHLFADTGNNAIVPKNDQAVLIQPAPQSTDGDSFTKTDTFDTGIQKVRDEIATKGGLNYEYPPFDPQFSGVVNFFTVPVSSQNLEIYSLKFEVGGVSNNKPFLVRGALSIGPISQTDNHGKVEVLDIIGEQPNIKDIESLLSFYIERPDPNTFTLGFVPKIPNIDYSYLKISSDYTDTFKYVKPNLVEVPQITGDKIINITTQNRSLEDSLYWKILDSSQVVVGQGVINITFNLDLKKVDRPRLVWVRGYIYLNGDSNNPYVIDVTMGELRLGPTQLSVFFTGYNFPQNGPVKAVYGSGSISYPDVTVAPIALDNGSSAQITNTEIVVFYR